MTPPIPTRDGEINCYNLSNSSDFNSRIYYVNGMRVLPRVHAVIASYLSLLVERPIWGVHNKTAGVYIGSLVDVAQCGLDYLQNATARTSSADYQNTPAIIPESQIPDFLRDLEKNFTVWNKATLALFKSLVENRHKMQRIIAHSQGNLITSNALFVIEKYFGSAALANIRVYSLASPSPGWPLGLRYTNGGGGRQENAFMNDLVALLRPQNLAAKMGIKQFQNAGDFRTDQDAWPVSLTPHDINLNIDTLNFVKSIRKDVGIQGEITPEFLAKCAALANSAFPQN